MRSLLCFFGLHEWARVHTLLRECKHCPVKQAGTVFGWRDTRHL